VSQQSLGEKLKELRESKSLTRDQLYSQTKILVRYIEALEEGRWDLLPGKAYLKPFVKNLAEALDADYNELYELIDTHIESKTEQKNEKESKKGFDYRWIAVILMVIIVAVVIYVFNPMSRDSGSDTAGEIPTPVVEPNNNNHAILEKEYSSDLDLNGRMFEGKTLHRVELTATDSVWVLLTSESDTLYSGLLISGRRIVRESLEPFVLLMGKANCLDVKYNGIKLDRGGFLQNRRRINFDRISLEPQQSSGEQGENL